METEVQLHSGMEGAPPIPDRGPRPGDYPGREQDTSAGQRCAGGVRGSSCGVLADVSVGDSQACGLRHHGMRRADQSPPRPRISATITGQITQTQS
jgi:hypothetical protein